MAADAMAKLTLVRGAIRPQRRGGVPRLVPASGLPSRANACRICAAAARSARVGDAAAAGARHWQRCVRALAAASLFL
jgi:hypothetical protein